MMSTLPTSSSPPAGTSNGRIVSRWHGSQLHSSQQPHKDSPSKPLLAPAAKTSRYIEAAGLPDLDLPNDVSSRFGRRLRQLRHERELTQFDMARKFGIDRSFISDVERGRKSISLPMLEIVAIGLELTLSELFQAL